ncbi:MAG: rhodanese-like domain-containing protein, partial [Nocardioides sp.]
MLDLRELGNRCHIVHDGASALVVDPPRHLGEVERATEEAGVEITAVADTHIHNDYVSGALPLARRHGADYLLSADEHVRFERTGVRKGATDRASGRSPDVLFSGGSLLHGTVGRTDLVDPLFTGELARAQWGSAQTLAGLDPATRLHPTHGFGSFCAGGAAAAWAGSDIGDEAATNPALRQDREVFVEALVAGFGPVPSYYRQMAPLNRSGAGARRTRPALSLTRDQVTDALADDAWVIDLRSRSAFARGHLPGTVSVEYAEVFATYVGWLLPWHDPLVLLTDYLPDLAPALRDLAAIGRDGVGTHVLDAPLPRTATYRRTGWNAFRSAAPGRVLVDVRQRDEFDAAHLPGAVNIPVQDVADRAGEIPPGEVWSTA